MTNNEDEITRLKNEVEALKKELLLKEAENEKLKKVNDDIFSSTSWKITKPLRILSNKK
ncbi:hypothetical protein [Methanosphaera sp. WGK6]|uniref:hypothetical protein n=1 Tax=Methanosphaera sp. WGK6 TaxID=1561964 RepID=UPI000A586D51|nr:hypothetical protein [Methanosphaera sp. WGK6]